MGCGRRGVRVSCRAGQTKAGMYGSRGAETQAARLPVLKPCTPLRASFVASNMPANAPPPVHAPVGRVAAAVRGDVRAVGEKRRREDAVAWDAGAGRFTWRPPGERSRSVGRRRPPPTRGRTRSRAGRGRLGQRPDRLAVVGPFPTCSIKRASRWTTGSTGRTRRWNRRPAWTCFPRPCRPVPRPPAPGRSGRPAAGDGRPLPAPAAAAVGEHSLSARQVLAGRAGAGDAAGAVRDGLRQRRARRRAWAAVDLDGLTVVLSRWAVREGPIGGARRSGSGTTGWPATRTA